MMNFTFSGLTSFFVVSMVSLYDASPLLSAAEKPAVIQKEQRRK
jgi:hypothetical protein